VNQPLQMQAAPLPPNEEERIQALYRLKILDTAPEPQFDDLTALAAALTGCPIALVSLIDVNRQWFKSKCGIDGSETDRSLAFCAHAILNRDLMEIPDARQDPRFAEHPMVVGEPHVTFYAGMPLTSDQGFCYGTLCVVDTKPRSLSDEQRDLLQKLGRQVLRHMEARAGQQQSINSSLLLARLLEFLPDGLITADVDGKLEHVNSIARQWHGVDPGTLPKERWYEYFKLYEADGMTLLPMKNNPITRVLRGERVRDVELVIRARNQFDRAVLCNGDALVDDQGAPAGAVIVMHDITARKEAQRRLAEKEKYLQALFDNVGDPIMVFMEDGIVVSANNAAVGLLNLRGRSDIDAFKLLPGLRGGIEFLGSEAGAVHHFEANALLDNGDKLPVELALSAIPRDGKARYVIILRDLSEQKRMERMKDDFVSTVSHELRTPLTAISGALSLIQGGVLGEVPEPMRELLAVAARNSQRLSAIINDLLDMDKLLAGKMTFRFETVDLSPLLDEALATMRSYAEPYGVNLARKGKTAVTVSVDTMRLTQVLTNLMSNACKFAPRDSSVILECAVERDTVLLSVIDSGPGIPEAFRARIFQKFSQADTSDTKGKGGTGLGLVICKELIERMHGAIGFESTPGKGTRFWVRLPVVS
jgi:signal transduction histidine kinase